MLSSTSQPLLFQRILLWLSQKAKENRISLGAALFFGFLAHGFAFANKLLNHDEAAFLFSKGNTLSLGRWGLDLIDWLLPNVSMPWIYGIVTIFLIAVSVCIMVNLLPLRSRWAQILAAGLILTFPSLTGTFAFMFTSSSYGVAFFLAVLAVWLIGQPGRKAWAFGLACMVFSLSIYQAYLCVSAGLLVCIVIRRLLDGEEAAAVLRRGLAYVGFLVLALGIYYGLTLCILRLKHVEMSSYAADGLNFSPLALPKNIATAYRAVIWVFLEGGLALVPSRFSIGVHIAIGIVGAVLLIPQWLRPDRSGFSKVLLAAAVFLFPLAISCIYLFIAFESIHSLVLYGLSDAYLLVLLLAEKATNRTPPRKILKIQKNAEKSALLL